MQTAPLRAAVEGALHTGDEVVHRHAPVADVRALFSRLPDRGIRLRGIGVDDGIDAAALTWAHRDPFDRMLVAQARRSHLTMVTRDLAICAFEPGCLVA